MDKLKMVNKANKKHLNKDYYDHNYSHMSCRLRCNYSLHAPNSEAKEYYFTKIIEALYCSPEIVDSLPSSMKGVDFENISYDNKCNAASKYTVRISFEKQITQSRRIDTCQIALGN
uniref:Uncharacterized protein n=1 Tax=Amphimedon queenslandica TaxID=400682 RepID=A0A1X7TLY8_AMPQE